MCMQKSRFWPTCCVYSWGGVEHELRCYDLFKSPLWPYECVLGSVCGFNSTITSRTPFECLSCLLWRFKSTDIATCDEISRPLLRVLIYESDGVEWTGHSNTWMSFHILRLYQPRLLCWWLGNKTCCLLEGQNHEVYHVCGWLRAKNDDRTLPRHWVRV